MHWKGNRGIVAARNPWIVRSGLKIRFDEADGLDANASKLVLERVYPTKWISPRLYRTGESVELPLEGFETAVYEVYPLGDATRPLLAGVRFDERDLQDGRHSITVFEGSPVMLNAQTVSEVTVNGRKTRGILKEVRLAPRPLSSSEVKAVDGGATIKVNIDPGVRTATVAMLVRPDAGFAGRALPGFACALEGRQVRATGEEEKGGWRWYLVTTGAGRHTLELTMPDSVRWKGTVSAWLLSSQEVKGEEIVCSTAKTVKLPFMPPRPWPADELRRTLPIGECAVGRR